MRLRHWLATTLSLGFVLFAPGIVFAEDAQPAAYLVPIASFQRTMSA